MIEAAQLRGERPLYTETAEWECLVQERHTADNPALVEEGRRQLLDQLTEGLSGDRAGTAAALRRLVEEETARLEELEAARREREAVEPVGAGRSAGGGHDGGGRPGAAARARQRPEAAPGAEQPSERRFSRPLNLPNRHPTVEVGTAGFSPGFQPFFGSRSLEFRNS